MKKYFYVFLASVIYYLVLAILKGQHYERLYGDIASAIAGFVGLYAFTYVLLKRNKEQKILWLLFVIWLGISIIELPMRIFYNKAMGTFYIYILVCGHYWGISVLADEQTLEDYRIGNKFMHSLYYSSLYHNLLWK